MPYNGIPPEKTAEMERCVKDVMGQGHDKSSAIAICHDSLMGSKKTKKRYFTKGGEKMHVKKIVIEAEDELKKQDGEDTQTKPAETTAEEVKTTETQTTTTE